MAKRKTSKRPAMTPERGFDFRDNRLYLRRGMVNPAFLESVGKKIRSGEYVHRETADDVEVYDLANWSPMLKHKAALGEMLLKQVENVIIVAACERDWRVYRDALQEYARRFKSGEVTTDSGEPLDIGSAIQAFQRSVAYLELRISRRGGPNPIEIQRAMSDLRKARKGRVYTGGRSLAVQ